MYVPSPEDVLAERGRKLGVAVKEFLGRCYRRMAEQFTGNNTVRVPLGPLSSCQELGALPAKTLHQAMELLTAKGWHCEVVPGEGEDERVLLLRRAE